MTTFSVLAASLVERIKRIKRMVPGRRRAMLYAAAIAAEQSAVEAWRKEITAITASGPITSAQATEVAWLEMQIGISEATIVKCRN